MGRKPLRTRVTTAALLVSPAVVVFAAAGPAQAEPKKPAVSCTAEVVDPQSQIVDGGEVEEITDTVVVHCEGLASEGKYKIVSTQREFVDAAQKDGRADEPKEPASRIDEEEMFVSTGPKGAFTAEVHHELSGPPEDAAKTPENEVAGNVVVYPGLGNTEEAKVSYQSDEFDQGKAPADAKTPPDEGKTPPDGFRFDDDFVQD
ncbi:hypothetical protein Lesp02_18950 [Lentzea sp. NBRC 105346]|uniref:hypothetical protein n=1 Tax=Lentzea sp. NBRC 105346 TaxID=3032205 RepID=UPI0024A0B5CD|nr:hypothetical protein [Lentzea sp. NBRC 105346]GLZ29705.1 hypothetical protein Lesp02_18950 [Lentzea sp. NBRC 105346]